MVLLIIIAFFSLIGLVAFHELGHFLLAKKFGVKVEEFGIGYPPRIFGKKIGETIYSINLLPLGAFVKIYGQEERIDDSRSFSVKPFWQKSLIILGGVISFWIISAILLTIVMALGAPTIIGDDENHTLINPKVQIAAVSLDSPAEQAGLKIGDTILNIKSQISNVKTDKVKEIQEFIEANKGREVVLTIQRGGDIFDISLVPRISYPENDGSMGVALARTALKPYPWHQALVKGVKATGELTWFAIKGWAMVISNLVKGEGLPAGVEIKGPVGIFELFTMAGALGASYFLQLVAIISIFLALFNLLPIPALDGGWFLFLVIEKLRGKPLNQKIVQNISVAFFFLLIALMIWVTIKDVINLF